MRTANAEMYSEKIFDLCRHQMEVLTPPFYRFRTMRQRSPNARIVLMPNDLWTYEKSTYIGLSEQRMYERALQRHPSIKKAA